MATVEERLALVEGRVLEQAERLSEVPELIRHLDQKLDQKIDGLRDRMDSQFKWLLGIIVTMWITLLMR